MGVAKSGVDFYSISDALGMAGGLATEGRADLRLSTVALAGTPEPVGSGVKNSGLFYKLSLIVSIIFRKRFSCSSIVSLGPYILK